MDMKAVAAKVSDAAGFSALPVLFLLSACSSGPSASDIKAVMQASLDTLFGPNMVTVEEVSNVECRAAQGKPGQVCSFTVRSFNRKLNDRGTATGEGRFVQNDSKWVMMNDK